VYEQVPGGLGPAAVGEQLKEDAAGKRGALIDLALGAFLDWKERVHRDTGLAFGLDYNALYQRASESPGEERAAGGVLRVFGSWTAIGDSQGDAGSLVFKLENRHDLGTEIAPGRLASEVGYVGVTGLGFSDFGWGVTNLYWQQIVAGNRFAFLAGVLDATDYLNVYGLVSPWTSFSNMAFSTLPTIAVPDQGLGVYARMALTEHVYVLGSLNDANGTPTQAGFDTFFDTREYFSAIETGWVGSYAERDDRHVKLTAWHVDEREEAGTPDGWGLAASADTRIDAWTPFVRAGYSDGDAALWEAGVSTGLGYHLRDSADLVGLGLSWSRPTGSGLDDQYTGELFYRVQLTTHLTITPDVQILLDPAQAPDEDVIAIFGLRARVAF